MSAAAGRPGPDDAAVGGPDPELVGQLAFRSQLRHIFRRVLTFLDDVAADLGLSPLGYHAILVLGGAGAEGVPERDLVEQLASSRAHISVLTRSLVEAGLVSRGAAPGDRRQVLLRLTPAGWVTVRRIAADHQARVRRLVDDWEPAALEAMLEQIMIVYLGQPGRVRIERGPGPDGVAPRPPAGPSPTDAA